MICGYVKLTLYLDMPRKMAAEPLYYTYKVYDIDSFDLT